MISFSVIAQLEKIPGWINLIPEDEQDFYSMAHEAYIGWVKEEERRWRDGSRRKDWLREWKEELGMQEFSKEARITYLRGEVKRIRTTIAELNEILLSVLKNRESGVLISLLSENVTKRQNIINKHVREISFRKNPGKDGEITDEMILRAKEYPIEQILKLERNGRAKCVFHSGEDGNMDIRKNYAYCYVCGKSSDSIGVYMAFYDCNFRQAVLALQ